MTLHRRNSPLPRRCPAWRGPLARLLGPGRFRSEAPCSREDSTGASSLPRPSSLLAPFAAALLAAALLGPAVPCAAQDKPPAQPPKRVVRTHPTDGTSAPSLPITAHRATPPLAPFGIGHWDAEVPETEPSEPGPDVGVLAEFLRSLVAPADADSVEISELPGRLVVNAPEDAHRTISAALESIRRSTGAPYEIDVRAVTVPEGPDGDALIAETAAAAANVPEALVRRLLAADVERGLRGGSTGVHGGHATQIDRTRQVPVVTDWDVEIAQAASIADPVPQAVADGLRAEVRARGMTGGRALVDVTAATGDAVLPFRRVEMRTKDLGSSEMPEVRAAFASASAVLAPGQTAAVVLASATAEHGATRRVLLVRLVEAPPAPGPARAEVVPCAAVAQGARVPYVWFANPAGSRREGATRCVGFTAEGDEAAVDSGAVIELLKGADPEGAETEGNAIAFSAAWSGGSVFLAGDPAWRARLREALAALEREAVRPARLDVRLVARPEAGAERTLGALAAPVVLGRATSLCAYDAVAYVGDYDVEVAQEARIADPLPECAIGGAVVNATVVRGAAGSLRVDLVLSASSVGAVESVPAGATEVGQIERVTVRRASVSRSVVVEPGKAREIDLGANPWSPPGRPERLVAVVRAE